MADEFRVLYLTADRGAGPWVPDESTNGPAVETVGTVARLGDRLAAGAGDCVVVGEDADRDDDSLAALYETHGGAVPFVHVTTDPDRGADDVVGDAVHVLAAGRPVPFDELAATAGTDAAEPPVAALPGRDGDATADAERVHLESHLERVTDAFFALDTEFRFRYVNERAAELIEVDPDEVLGDLVWDRFPAAVGSQFQAEYERAMADQEPVSFEEYFPPLSTWFSVRAYPSETGLSVYFRDVTERKEHERALERQRDELEGLAQLNRVVQHVTETLVTAANRAKVERTVCDQLVESSLFAAAWLGRVDSRRDCVDPAADAGHGGFEPPATVPVGESASHPAGRAVASQSVECVADLSELAGAEPWAAAALDRGFASVAAVPVSYKGTRYGVVTVFATKPGAFTEGVVDALAQLQSVVGLAINATERRAALIADGTVQVELTLRDASNRLFRAVAEHGVSAELDGATALDDHTFVQYFTLRGDPGPALFETIRSFERVEELSVLDRGTAETLVTLTVVDPPISTLLAEHGGTIRELVVDEDGLRLVAELPKSASVRSLVDSFEETFASVDLRAKRERKRPEQRVSEFRSTLENRLTDRQREAVETALREGYFEWPRGSDAEEIAASLGIASPTFHEHLRAAQQKLFSDLFDVPPSDRDPRAEEHP